MIRSDVPGPAVRLDQVAVNEGKQVLLEPLDCEFVAGHWHAVIGPNGSGKSSLLKTLLGLKNHKGQVSLQWQNVQETPSDVVARIGYMPQLVPFDASLPISLRDYVLMTVSRKPVILRRDLDEEVINALQHLRLDNKLDRRLGDLSGGERQRLMLMCTLLLEPDLLILDEPMSGLDASGCEDAIELISCFRNAGGTVIMVEHNWALVEAHCDYVYWLDKNIKASGPCDQFEQIIKPMAGFAAQMERHLPGGAIQ